MNVNSNSIQTRLNKLMNAPTPSSQPKTLPNAQSLQTRVNETLNSSPQSSPANPQNDRVTLGGGEPTDLSKMKELRRQRMSELASRSIDFLMSEPKTQDSPASQSLQQRKLRLNNQVKEILMDGPRTQDD